MMSSGQGEIPDRRL